MSNRRPLRNVLASSLLVFPSVPAAAQETGFDEATASIERRLAGSLDELSALREEIVAEKLPLDRRMNELEAELSRARADFQRTTALLNSRSLDLSNLTKDVEARKDETAYLSSLLGDYLRNFESGLGIADLQRLEPELDRAHLAMENPELGEREVFDAQLALVDRAITRLEDALGGDEFEGTAVAPDGVVQRGTFLTIGPATFFRPESGGGVATVEQRLGSLEPTQVRYSTPEAIAAAEDVFASGGGAMPLDPTLGNAHRVESTQETLVEHVQKGGPVMVPIFVMAGLALLVALVKWLSMAFLGKPSRRRIQALLDSLSANDVEVARRRVGEIKGPVGKMLAAGVEHLGEPRELIEEVMYETVLTTRLKLQRMLPFIAICAASAPLLGLLGTVTGIIKTFKLITVFGSGDVKMLSAGISEALITTEFGLIIAIPSLLLHAFLSRKARGIVGQMETSAIAFVNEVSRSPFERGRRSGEGGEGGERGTIAAAERVRDEVRGALGDLLERLDKDGSRESPSTQPA